MKTCSCGNILKGFDKVRGTYCSECISKVDVAFNNTMFAFNEKGLSQAIDRIIEVYPESLEPKIKG